MSFRPPRRRKHCSSRTPQQFGLQHQRDLADLVEEKRAFVGQFEDATLLRPGVGEGALLVAEQLALKERLRNGGAIDGDKRLGLPQALMVQSLGDQVLACSILAFQQNRGGFAGGHAADEVQQVPHAGGLGNHLALLGR